MPLVCGRGKSFAIENVSEMTATVLARNFGAFLG